MKTILLMFLSVVGYSETADSMFKVESYDRVNRSAFRLMESGTAFSIEKEGKKEYFFLTNSHGIFHGSTQANIEIALTHNKLERPLLAALEATNFAVDLTFIRPISGAMEFLKQVSIPFEQVQETERRIREQPKIRQGKKELFAENVILRALPFHMSKPLNVRAKVLTEESDVKFLPLIPELMEIEGHIEEGMSGGGVFTEEEDYIGMATGRWPKGDGVVTALAVRLKDIVPWVNQVLRGDKSADLRLELEGQKHGITAIAMDKMLWSEKLCDSQALPTTTPGPVGGDPGGVGGDPGGVGGDPGGVAFEPEFEFTPKKSKKQVCAIQVTRQWSTGQSWPFLKKAWYSKRQEDLPPTSPLTLVAFVKKGSANYSGRMELRKALKLIQLGYTPLFSFPDNFTPVSVSGVKERRLIEQANILIRSVRKLRTLDFPEKSAEGLLLRDLFLIATTIMNRVHNDELTDEQLNHSKNNSTVWANLFELNDSRLKNAGESAQEARRAFTKIYNELKGQEVDR